MFGEGGVRALRVEGFRDKTGFRFRLFGGVGVRVSGGGGGVKGSRLKGSGGVIPNSHILLSFTFERRGHDPTSNERIRKKAEYEAGPLQREFRRVYGETGKVLSFRCLGTSSGV